MLPRAGKHPPRGGAELFLTADLNFVTSKTGICGHGKFRAILCKEIYMSCQYARYISPPPIIPLSRSPAPTGLLSAPTSERSMVFLLAGTCVFAITRICKKVQGNSLCSVTNKFAPDNHEPLAPCHSSLLLLDISSPPRLNISAPSCPNFLGRPLIQN